MIDLQNHLPKISIITPSFNQGSFLEQTILSVINQQYPNLEYIIIDGGSTDGSIDIIKKYEQQITYWVSEKDKGQYDAVNKGFDRSTGAIMAFLNADDVYLPWTLQTVASAFTAFPEMQWLTSLAPFQKNDEGILFGSGTINPISKNAFLDGYYIPGRKKSLGVIVQEGTFWARQLWQKAGACINTEVSLAGDFDLWCKFFEFTEPHCLGHGLAAMTRHKDQRSNMLSLYVQQCVASLRVLQYKYPNVSSVNSLKTFLFNLARLNRFTWLLGKKISGYAAWTIEPAIDKNFKLVWKKQKTSVYIR